jgi:hypothetical protein
MSNPTRVGFIRVPIAVSVGLRDGEFRWWVDVPRWGATPLDVPRWGATPLDVPRWGTTPSDAPSTVAPWVRRAPAPPPGGRIYREASGYLADSPCFLIGDRSRGHETPEAAAAEALRREVVMAPVADGIARAHGGRAAVFLMDGNRPDFPWVWRPDPTARPENLAPWERQAVAAASAYRRFSVILKDLDECRTWVVEAVAGGVGIARLARDPEGASTRWLARAGGKHLLMGRTL